MRGALISGGEFARFPFTAEVRDIDLYTRINKVRRIGIDSTTYVLPSMRRLRELRVFGGIDDRVPRNIEVVRAAERLNGTVLCTI